MSGLSSFSVERQNYSGLLEKILISANKILHSHPYSEVQVIRNYLDQRLSTWRDKKYTFGYLPPIEKFDQFENLFSIQDLLQSKILYQHSSFTNLRNFFQYHPLIFPYYDEYGYLVSLTGRTVLSERERKDLKIDKYKNLFFNRNHYLFGLFQARSSILENKFVVLVEGQFDCFAAWQKKFYPIIALGGTSFSPEQKFILRRWTKKIYLLLNPDTAGQKGQEKILNNCDFDFDFSKIELPKGYKDLDEFFLKHSREEFVDLIPP